MWVPHVMIVLLMFDQAISDSSFFLGILFVIYTPFCSYYCSTSSDYLREMILAFKEVSIGLVSTKLSNNTSGWLLL